MAYTRLADYRIPDDQEIAGLPVRTQDQALTVLGFHQIALTGGAAATFLTAGNAVDAGTTQVLLSIETSTVRIRLDGTAATATTGHPLAVGTVMTLTLKDFTKVSFYAAASATVNYSCMQSVA